MANYNFSYLMDEDDDDNVFRDVLKTMMFSFGDVKEPMEESVDIVYKILREEMDVLLMEAERVANFRKSKEISHEEMLFLMRKNKGKLKRLIKFLQVMDESPGFGKSALFCSNVLKKGPKKGRADKCIEFLASIEDCGEFTSILQDPTIIDVAHRNMLERRNTMTKWMDLNEYKDFTKQILEKSFCAKQNFHDFEKWLLEDSAIEMNLTTLAFEIIRFLARETVSKIVDLALIIKSKKNNKFKRPEISLKPFNFYEVTKECNAVESCPSPSIADKTARNTNHSYFDNKDSNDSSIVHFHSVRSATSISGTSKDFGESKASTKDIVDKLRNSSDVPVKSKDLATPKVITMTTVPSVIWVKDASGVDNLHHPTNVPETPEDFAGQNKPDLESVSMIPNKDHSDSITQQSTVTTNVSNEDQPMDESDNQYFVVENAADSHSKQHDSHSDDGTQQSNTNLTTSYLQKFVSKNPDQPGEKFDNFITDSMSDAELKGNSMHSSNDTTLSVNTSMRHMTTPDVTPSHSRYSSNEKSDNITRKHQEPLENGSHPQTPITPAEIIQAVAMFRQHSWSNYFHSSDKRPKIKLLCIDEHVSVRI